MRVHTWNLGMRELTRVKEASEEREKERKCRKKIFPTKNMKKYINVIKVT